MPQRCEAFAITPLLRELILRATELPVEYDERGSAGRVMRLILDELASLVRLPYNLPMPASKVLSRICRALIDSPTTRSPSKRWGRATAPRRARLRAASGAKPA